MNQVILRDWYCEKCSLQFDKKYVYDLHLKLVHGQEIKVKTEPTSEENFEEPPQNEKVLSDHITPVADKTFQCDICKHFVKSKGNLKRHMNSVHAGKKPFECIICSARFTQKPA